LSRRYLSLPLVLLLLIGCAKNQGDGEKKGLFSKLRKNKDKGGETKTENNAKGKARFDDTGKIRRELDLNYDQVPDVWKVYAKGSDGKEYLVRKEMDINYDGKVDIYNYYNEDGVLIKDELDLDRDGKIDATTYYEKGKPIKKEEDLEFDEKPDLVKFYEDGKLVRKERDTNNDGRIDVWEYFTNGQIDRVGRDTNADGTVDIWERPGQPNEPASAPAPSAAK
jgi:hypothetical protein